MRRDLAKAIKGIDPRYTHEAAERLKDLDRSVLVAWGADDRLFPIAHGERLAASMRDGRLESIHDSYTFVPEDQPERLAALIGGFVRAKVAR